MNTKTPLKKPLELLTAGKHIANSGASFDFSESDLAATAAAYDAKIHEAPLVVGHPAMDAPAYGYVESLQFADGSLTAIPQDVDPQFAELVNARRYGKLSASFYAPNSPSNPVHGVYYLRHVGFLGAHPPAIKGLRNPSFSDNASDLITIEFAEPTAPISPTQPIQQDANVMT